MHYATATSMNDLIKYALIGYHSELKYSWTLCFAVKRQSIVQAKQMTVSYWVFVTCGKMAATMFRHYDFLFVTGKNDDQ